MPKSIGLSKDNIERLKSAKEELDDLRG